MKIDRMLLSLVLVCLCFRSYSQGCEIEISFKSRIDATPTLSYFYGMKSIVIDTAFRVDQSTFMIKRETLLEQGLYLLHLDKNKYIEVLIGEDQTFTINTDSLFRLENIEIGESKETEAFLDYQKFMAGMNQRKALLQQRQILYSHHKDSLEYIKNEISEMNKAIKDEWFRIVNMYPNTLLSHIIMLFMLPEIPDFKIPANEENIDSIRWFMGFKYYRQHYLDNVILNDERLLRVPTFHEIIFTYVTKIVVQEPDSLYRAIDKILTGAQGNEVVLRFLMTSFLNYYESTTSTGADEVFVHIVDNYYLQGKAPWVDLKFQKELDAKASRKRNTLIGNVFELSVLIDNFGNKIDLKDMNANRMILMFWSLDCEYCKNDINSLNNIAGLSEIQVKVLTLSFDIDKVKWEEYVNKLQNMMHVNVWKEREEIENKIYIKNLPKYMILDENKRIISKPANYRQLEKEIMQPASE